METVTLFAAFIAGILSFISPCVLPLVPGYISFMSGLTLEELSAGGDDNDLLVWKTTDGYFCAHGLHRFYGALRQSSGAYRRAGNGYGH